MMVDVGALLGKWATGKSLDWLAKRFNKPGLKRDIRSALEDWIKMDVPSDLRFNEQDLDFTNTNQTPVSFMGKVCDLIEKKSVPPESLWFEALMERWGQISVEESVEKAVPQFFQLAEKPKAEECLRKLAKRIYLICTSNPDLVGTTLIETAQRTEFCMQKFLEHVQGSITLKEHEQKLKQREKEIRGNIATAHEEEKFIYEKALYNVQNELSYLQQSYDKTVQRLAETYMDLESLRKRGLIEGLRKRPTRA